MTTTSDPLLAPAAPDWPNVESSLKHATPIIQALNKNGRAGMMEAIAETMDPVDGAMSTFGTLRVGAQWLRVMARNEKK